MLAPWKESYDKPRQHIKNLLISVLIKDRRGEDTEEKRQQCEEGSGVGVCSHKTRNAWSHQKLEDTGKICPKNLGKGADLLTSRFADHFWPVKNSCCCKCKLPIYGIWLWYAWCSSKESTCQCMRHKRLRFDPWVGNIPWSRKWQPTLVFLPRKFYGQSSLVGYSPWGCKELDTTEHLKNKAMFELIFPTQKCSL